MDSAARFESDIETVAGIPAVPSILDVVCQTTGMGFAAVARVTEDRWIACGVRDDIGFGLRPGGELKVESTICDEIRDSRQVVVFDNADEDPRYSKHHTPEMYGLKSYISVPIILGDDSFFGTLCAIDPKPAAINSPKIVGMFKLFAELIAQHIDNSRQTQDSRAELLLANEMAELRDQFIAVLGHDLRNPLGAIVSAADLLGRTAQTERGARLIEMMQKSASRMNELIENVLDFARGRLGAGVSLSSSGKPLKPAMDQVVSELRAKWPDRMIEIHFDALDTAAYDSDRIAQLFSNLLGNALTYGAADAPVRVRASSGDTGLHLSVENAGATIPADKLKRLFLPFTRGETPSDSRGLGLGLYISSEIARAHGGHLSATSADGRTCFSFDIPPPPVTVAE